MTAFEKYMTDMKSKKASAMKFEDDEEVTSTVPKFTEQPPLTTQSTPVSPERQDKDKYVLKNARTHNASSSLVYQKMATVPFDPEAFKGNAMSKRLEGKFREMVGSVNLEEGEGVDVFRTSPRPSEKRQRTEEQGGEEGGEEGEISRMYIRRTREALKNSNSDDVSRRPF